MTHTAANTALVEEGLVVASHGRHVWVETATGKCVLCHPRGKKNQAVVGDKVLWQATQDEGTIEAIQARKNLLYRQDEIRTKSFAANLDQVLLLIAAYPQYSESQLSRALIATQAQGIAPLIALNKSDLSTAFNQAWQQLAPYRDMGYTVLPLALKPEGSPQESSTAANATLQTLATLLTGKTTLILGPSGAGKSTLINRLVAGAQVLTNTVSSALNSGKHTTTSTRLYWVDPARKTAVIDSPGFQEFGLNHIDPMQLALLMPDMKPFACTCKFYNCTHLHEPGCSLVAQVETSSNPGKISARRYKIYSNLFAELSRKRY